MHLAVMLDPFLPLTELLLQRGADVNAQTHTGATPLLLSVQAFEVRPAVFVQRVLHHLDMAAICWAIC